MPLQIVCLECFACTSMDLVFWARVLLSPSCLVAVAALLHYHGDVGIIGPFAGGDFERPGRLA